MAARAGHKRRGNGVSHLSGMCHKFARLSVRIAVYGVSCHDDYATALPNGQLVLTLLYCQTISQIVRRAFMCRYLCAQRAVAWELQICHLE